MNQNHFFLHFQFDIGHSGQVRDAYSVSNGRFERQHSSLTFLGVSLGCGADIHLGKNIYLEPLYRLRYQQSDQGQEVKYTYLVLGLMAKF